MLGRQDSVGGTKTTEARLKVQEDEIKTLKRELSAVQNAFQLRTEEVDDLRRQIVLLPDPDNSKTKLSAKDEEIAMLKMQLQYLDADKAVLDGFSAQIDSKESMAQLWKEKALNALKTRDEVSEQNRLLLREVRQGKAQVKVKESEVTVLEEKLRMMEDVILKSRNKRLEELDNRMKQEVDTRQEREALLAQLTEQLAQAQGDNQKLIEELATRKAANDEVQQQHHALLAEIRKFDSILGVTEVRDAAQSFGAITAALEKGHKFDDEIARLQKELDQERSSKTEIEQSLAQRTDELSTARDGLNSIKSDLEVAQKSLSQLEESSKRENQTLEHKTESQQQELNRLQLELESTKQLEQKARENYETASKDVKEKTEKLKEVSLKAEVMEGERNRFEIELKPLQARYLALDQEKEQLEKQTTQLKDRIDALQSELASKTQQVDFFSEQVKTAEMKVGMTEEEADALVDKIIELEHKLETRETMLRAVTNELRETKRELNAQRQNAIELDEKVATTTQMARQHEEQLYLMNEKVEMAVLEVKARDDRLRSLIAEAELMRKEVQSADVQLMTSFQRLKAMEDKLRSKEEEFRHATARSLEFETELGRTKGTLTSTMERLTAAKAHSNELAKKLQEAQEKVHLLEDTVSTKTQQLSLMKQKMEFARHEARSKDDEAFHSRRQLEEQRIEMAALTEEIAPLRARIAELKETASQKRGLEKHVWLLNEKINVLQEEIRAREDETDFAKKRSHMSELQVKSLHQKVDELTGETVRLEAELSMARASLKRSQDEINRFRASKELMQAMQIHEFMRAGKVSQTEVAAKQIAESAAPRPATAAPSLPAGDGLVDPEVQSRELKELQQKLVEAEKALKSQSESLAVLDRELQKAQAEMAAREQKMEMTVEEYFNSTVLVVKMMLNERQQRIDNILATDLFAEVQSKQVPVEDWPMYVYLRMAATAETTA